MELALYAPGLGYYSARQHEARCGRAISSRRRSSAARSAARSRLTLDAELAALGSNDVVELGAGSGALAAQLLDTFAKLGRDVRYRILEPSADLRERQQRALAPFADRVQWLDRLPETPLRRRRRERGARCAARVAVRDRGR